MPPRDPKRPGRNSHSRQLVILTGLSGSGKRSVLNTFEDLGFYCVDNLPVALIPTFSELYAEGRGEIERAALLVDAREGEQIDKLPAIFRKLSSEHAATLVFIEASENALLRRFSETRRPHPLGGGDSIKEGIREERRRMAPIRRLADVVIDTTRFNVHELRQFIIDRFQNPGRRPLLVSVVSFGFRYGIPTDADLVFDVRFLPNPHFVPRLRPFTGKDPRVARYIRSFPQTGEFLRRIESLLTYLIPHYIREGKSYLTVALGCTGGRHRSVALAEVIRRSIQRKGYATKVVHRDLDKSAT
ncbi:MAG TPA: RNase adapter RapZ [Candidatus Acidoferrales bacterium]|nr:RNase adapter RapZ [Candidatus Acidoferrales bacterium]